jgi:NADPH2:quinone reductase
MSSMPPWPGRPSPTSGCTIRTGASGSSVIPASARNLPRLDLLPLAAAALTGDVVGLIDKVGPEADPALTGTRVAVLLEDAYADYVVADADWLVSVPDGLATAGSPAKLAYLKERRDPGGASRSL